MKKLLTLIVIAGIGLFISLNSLQAAQRRPQSTVPVLVEIDSKKDFTFYIAPYIGIGGLFTNSIQLNDYPFLSGELRMGYAVSPNFFTTFFVDTGFNVRNASYPLITTISVGPEYFITEPISVFAAVGLGIITAEFMDYNTGSVVTRGGLNWKLGLNWRIFRWGEEKEYSIPISLSYSGTKNKLVTCHAVMFSTGFMFFN